MTAREPEDRPTAGEVAATLGGLTADARAGSTGPASVTPMVPLEHAAGTAVPGRVPSGTPAADDDAPTEVGEAPYPAGRPVTSRRRRRATWGLSAAAAAAVAAMVTVAATWSGASSTGQPAPGASGPATPTPSAAHQTHAASPSSTAAPVAATGTAVPVSTPTTRPTTAAAPRRSPIAPSAPSPRPGSGSGSKHQAGPKAAGTKPGPPKAKSGPGKGTSGGGKGKHHGGKAKQA
jgi:hypothetical protein